MTLYAGVINYTVFTSGTVVSYHARPQLPPHPRLVCFDTAKTPAQSTAH